MGAIAQAREGRESDVASNQAPLVLIVDDDQDFLEMTRNVLETTGYRVACAHDAEEALETIAEGGPALVITDLMMKAMATGFSLSRRIKESPGCSEVPVIIVTAAGSRLGYDFVPRSSHDLAAMCADAFFEKPVPPKALLAKIADLLGERGRHGHG